MAFRTKLHTRIGLLGFFLKDMKKMYEMWPHWRCFCAWFACTNSQKVRRYYSMLARVTTAFYSFHSRWVNPWKAVLFLLHYCLTGNRFPLEPNRIVPAGISRTSRSFNSSLRDALMMASTCASTGRLTHASTVSPLAEEGRHSTLVEESEAASLEARRLASFPSGQPPDASSVPAIDRYDWPAPAFTAVMTAELSRFHYSCNSLLWRLLVRSKFKMCFLE